MSSYFDYYCKNVQTRNHDTDKIHGTCYSMCPQDEMKLRVKENLVHMLEVVGSERKLVKSYSRSAADSNMVVPQHLRPYSVLKETVEYLIFEVSKRSDIPFSVVYDFVNDRLRAVRQDITIQRLEPEQCRQLLEPMVRFYVYFGYRLHGLPLKDYDPVLNKKYLLECIKWFLSCCDTSDEHVDGKVDELSSVLGNLTVNGNHQLSCDRVLIESLYILCNLDDVHPLFRYIGLPKSLKMHPRLQLAYQVAIANLNGNFIRIGKLLKKLCPLSYCAVCLHLPIIQRRAIGVLCAAYSSKQLCVPSAALRRWLSLASDWEARAAAAHYGLPLADRQVRFDRSCYKHDVPAHTPKIQLLDDGTLDLSMEHVFTYTL